MARISDFNGDYVGLSKTEIAENRKIFSKNLKRAQSDRPLYVLALSAVLEPLFIMLALVAALSFISGEPLCGIAAALFAAAHALLNIVTEMKADGYAEQLALRACPKVPVLSKEEIVMLPAYELLPGDIIVLEKGDEVPADCTVLEQHGLMADEFVFTNDHAPNYKYAESKKDDGKLKQNCVYLGTKITEGKAVAKVLAVGERALLFRSGKAQMEPALRPEKSEKAARRLYTRISYGSLAILALSMLYLLIAKNGLNFSWCFNGAAAVAAAIIPAAIPAAVSLIVLINAKRQAKAGICYANYKISSKLKNISVLCVDKTGVITGNKIKVADTFAPQKSLLAHISTLACGSYSDDPIDRAIVDYCARAGADVAVLQSNYLVHSYPLEPSLKMCGHIWKIGDSVLLCAKGSPEAIMDICSISEEERLAVKARQTYYSKKGYSVIAVACKELPSDSKTAESLREQSNLSFVGLIALSDPPRASVTDSVRLCNDYGIRVLMVTGDSIETAAAVAGNIGINTKNGIISGETLHNCTDDELVELAGRACVFARVAPEDKLRLVKALKRSGERVAVTVESNSEEEIAKAADVSFCMSESTQPYAKENADIIVKSNSFEKIVAAILDGKILHSRIVKTVGCALSVYITMFLTNIISMLSYGSLPVFLPVDIAYISLLLTAASAVIFSGIKYYPRGKHTNNLTIALRTLTMSVSSMVLFRLNFAEFEPETMRGFMLCFFTLMMLLVIVSESDDCRLTLASLIKMFGSKAHIAVLAGVLILTLVFAFASPAASFLSAGRISLSMLAVSVLTASLVCVVNDIIKVVKRR